MWLAAFSAVQLAVHFCVLGAAKALFGLPIRELAVASNAAVGGPTTAAAMATAKGWDDLVLPALLVGILGYATGTFVSIGALGTPADRGRDGVRAPRCLLGARSSVSSAYCICDGDVRVDHEPTPKAAAPR